MTDNLELHMDAYLPLRDVVFQTLRSAILKGDLRPGERLMEIQLANKLGVSRTPIREAIRMLEKEGLAYTVPRKGAVVAKMTEKDMEDVLEVRLALEDLALELSCKNIDDATIRELENAMNDFERLTVEGDVGEIAQADVKFHDILYRSSGNQKLLSILGSLHEQMFRYRVEYLKDKNIYKQLIAEHREMYDGILTRDYERVSASLRRHLHNQGEAIKRMIREQG